MNIPSQPPQPAQPDMALLLLGSFFEGLHHAPVRDDAKLDALAMQILDESPKTLPGLVIRACAEKWLRRHLWTLAFEPLASRTGCLRCHRQCDPDPISTATGEHLTVLQGSSPNSVRAMLVAVAFSAG